MRPLRNFVICTVFTVSAASASTLTDYSAFKCANMNRMLLVQNAYFEGAEGTAAEIAQEVCEATSSPDAAAMEWLQQHVGVEFGVHLSPRPTVFIRK